MERPVADPVPAGGRLLSPEGRSALLRGAGFVVLLAGVAVLGLWAGGQLRRSFAPPPAAPAPPAPAFGAGDPFPSVPLIAEDGAAVASDDLLAGRGGVVLFLDSECPACTQAVGVWQSLLEAGELGGLPVVGIGREAPDVLTAYRERLGLGFPCYSDPGAVFSTEHGVTAVPTTVVVDAQGTVRFAGFLPTQALDPEEIVELAGG